MKALTKYALANLRQNKRRTIVTVIGVALSCALLFVVTGLAATLHYALINSAIDTYGDYDAMLESVPGDKISRIENYSQVKIQYYSEELRREDLGRDSWYLGSKAAINKKYIAPINEATDRVVEHKYNVFVKFNDYEHNARNNEFFMREAGAVAVHENTDLRMWRGDLDKKEKNAIAAFALLTYGTIIIASIFIIRNAFSISANERIRQFGILMSIGARPRQIRQLVYIEALFIWLVAVPLSILIGGGVIFGLVVASNTLLFGDYDFKIDVMLPALAFIIPVILGVVTILLSSVAAAFMASEQSPISAIRNSKEIKDNDKKYKSSKTAESFWGISGVIASKNLKRSRKKYHTTVISIVISTALFVGFSSITGYIDKVLTIAYPNGNVAIMGTSNDAEVVRGILENTKYNQAVYYHSEDGVIDPSGDFKKVAIQVTSREYFKNYAKKSGIKEVNLETDVILNDTFVRNGSYGRQSNYKVGDVLSLQMNKFTSEDEDSFVVKFNDFKITAISETNGLGFDDMQEIALYVSEDNTLIKEWMSDMYGETADMLAFYIDVDGLGNEVDEYLESVSSTIDNDKHFYYFNISKSLATIHNTVTLINVFVYCFIVIIALIGATNVFNTISANMSLRAREFAMLKSVGMTKKEFNTMIRIEGVMYTVRAMLIGIPLGLLISYGFYMIFDTSVIELTYVVPYTEMTIAAVSVLLLILSVMSYSVKQVEKQNIIGTIRNESI